MPKENAPSFKGRIKSNQNGRWYAHAEPNDEITCKATKEIMGFELWSPYFGDPASAQVWAEGAMKAIFGDNYEIKWEG